ncbi:MAG TPA: DUF6496 domain-containing protein [Gemmataceae bacterium]
MSAPRERDERTDRCLKRVAFGTEFEQFLLGRYTVSGTLQKAREQERDMARKYDEKSQKTVHEAMHKYKHGELKSGKTGHKVKNRKQAVAIGLSEARKKGAKVPAKKKSSK